MHVSKDRLSNLYLKIIFVLLKSTTYFVDNRSKLNDNDQTGDGQNDVSPEEHVHMMAKFNAENEEIKGKLNVVVD